MCKLLSVHKVKVKMEMTKKRSWLSKIYTDSQETNTNADISWSNSDSDEDFEEPKIKKRMTDFLQTSKTNHWLNLSVTPSKENPHLEGQGKNPVPTLQREFLESPILRGVQLADESPVLNQGYVLSLKETSPVISRNSVVRKLRWRYRRKKNAAKPEIILDETVDTFTQSTLIIENPLESPPEKEHDISIAKTQLSQSAQSQEEDPQISPVKTQSSQIYKIDPFPSQHSTEIVSDSLSSCSDPQPFPCNHLSRKKHFKKGSLGSQLQKAIDLQSSSAAIWQHEMFLSKSKGEEIHQSNVSGEVRFEFFVRNKWMEYGCIVLESQCNSQTDARALFTGFSQEINNYDTFLLITGLTNASNVCFESNKAYQIFPPYSTKVVNFYLKKTLCVFNASRFISL